MMRTANPALNSKTFEGFALTNQSSDTMTINGTVNKTAILLFLIVIAASWVWHLFYTAGNPAIVFPWIWGGATGGICLVYLATFILSFFKIQIPFIYGSGLFGIIFSLIVVVVASLNLVLDFDFIENGAAKGAPKYMEWYGAFGLMVTLIWLYIEILRLLAKLRSR